MVHSRGANGPSCRQLQELVACTKFRGFHKMQQRGVRGEVDYRRGLQFLSQHFLHTSRIAQRSKLHQQPHLTNGGKRAVSRGKRVKTHAQLYSAPCLRATFTFRLRAIYLSSSQVWQKLSNLCRACLHVTAKEENEQKPTEINSETCQTHHRVVFFLLSLNDCAESSGLMWKAFEIQRLLITTPHRSWLACSLWFLRCWIFAFFFF